MNVDTMACGVRTIDARIPMRDGSTLAADVTLPDGGEQYPVLLLRTPYSRSGARSSEDPIGIARMGWAVVVQDVRGTGDSGGSFEPFHQELTDGYDTIEWCSMQPWSTGHVAMQGGSYLGITQLLAASSGHPALVAIAPAITGSDIRDGWTYEGGALAHGFVTSWAAGLMSITGAVDSDQAELLYDYATLLDMPLGSSPLPSLWAPYRHWLDRADDSYWEPIRVASLYQEMDVAGFHLGGWYDTFIEGTIRNYQGMGAKSRGFRPQRLVIAPWSHDRMWLRDQGDLDFGAPASEGAAGIKQQILTFLRSSIESPDEVIGGARIFVMGINEWRDYDTWPPATAETKLYLSSSGNANSRNGDGRLTWSLPLDPAADTFTYDPSRPVPTVGGRGIDMVLVTAGPRDQRRVEERDDVLVYTSGPMTEAIEVLGEVRASFCFKTSGTSADVVAKLCVVDPDGRSINVVEGIVRKGFVSERIERVEVTLGSTAITILPGQQLRVQVCSSNFPRYDRNPSDGSDPAQATTYLPAQQGLHTGDANQSWIELPLAPRSP